MEKEVVSYIKHHTFQVFVLVVSIFVILAVGEFYLYRKTQEINMMLSEGLMQIKEEMGQVPTVTPTVTQGVKK